jgi:protein phosphatase 4 regulatory subunit 3
VVLARILDDPTFSVLNSLIFFHQVDIVNHLQASKEFLQELFDIFGESNKEESRKKEAVQFIQTCCAVSKNIQGQNRAQLYQNFIGHGLFAVITFALRHQDAAVRVAGTDILVALIDHDPVLVRNHIFNAIREKTTPLTDTLIELLLVEVDLGVKSQMADAIKILLDPGTGAGMEMMTRQPNSELMNKRGNVAAPNPQINVSPQTEEFIQSFYTDSAKRLFQPLKDLEHRSNMLGLSVQETSLYTHLVEVLCFFVRQHQHRSKYFILSENLHSRVAQLLTSPQKYMKLTALKWFRTCIGLQDEFHNRQMIQYRLFEPILDIVYQTMPRDSLLNSACLELFEFIKREGVRQIIIHLSEQYRERLMAITYVNTFQQIVLKYDQMQAGFPGQPNGTEDSSFTTQEGTPRRLPNGRQPSVGLRDMDPDEEAYFNADDDAEEDEDAGLPTKTMLGREMTNGASPVKPLVNYPDDDDEPMDILASSPDRDAQLAKDKKVSSSSEGGAEIGSTSPESQERGRSRDPVPVTGSPEQQQQPPPEPIAMKRRREEEEDDDELGKLMGGSKRRNSSASVTSQLGRGLLLDGASSSSSLPSLNRGVDGSSQQSLLQQPVDESQLPTANSQPVLRRKGNLKAKNEGQGALAKFTIEPKAMIAAVTNQHQTTEHQDGQENGGGSSSGGDKG